MALSGSFYTNVGSHWRLQLEWTGSQNISGNYTNVTAKLYWIATSSYGAVYSSATKTAGVIIDGTTDTNSTSAALSGNQKKLIHTYTKRVDHNANGTGDVTLDGWFDAEVTLSGTYYGRINLTAKTFTLNTIPRASSLSSSSQNWTAGSNVAVSISRASSTFTHSVDFYVEQAGSWNWIAQVTGVGYSATMSFTEAQNKEIFTAINGSASARTLVRLITYSGSTEIGRKDYNGTVTAPTNSLLTSAFDHYVYVDQEITGAITRYHSNFLHTVTIKLGSFTKTLTNVGTSFSWTPNATEQQSLYSQMPTVKNKDGSIEVTTYYEGVKVRTTRSDLLQFHVRNSEPTFADTQISYKDTNATTVAMTGNDQSIIQNQSSITAYVNTSATARNGASLVKYIVSVAGIEKEITTATGNVSIGKVNLGTNQSLEITAVDSRGFTKSVSKTVTMIPYTEPSLVLKLARRNKFEASTDIDVTGTFSTITVGGANKNLIQGLSYSYKPKGATSWTATNVPITFTTSGNTITGTKFNLTLDNTKVWEFEFSVNDKILTATAVGSVGAGQPILFIDSEKKSVGVGVFPSNSDALEIKGNMVAQDGFFRNIYSKLNWMPVVEQSGTDLALNSHGGRVVIGNRSQTTGVSIQKPVEVTGDYIEIGTKKLYDVGGYLRVATKGSTSSSAKEPMSMKSAFLDVGLEGAGGKAGNGYNLATMRNKATSNKYTLIQNVVSSCTFSAEYYTYKDISFPAGFDDVFWAIAVPVNSSSFGFICAVYNLSNTGCRVYMRHNTDQSYTGTIDFQLVAGGDKS